MKPTKTIVHKSNGKTVKYITYNDERCAVIGVMPKYEKIDVESVSSGMSWIVQTKHLRGIKWIKR
jgi:hypothetical protein